MTPEAALRVVSLVLYMSSMQCVHRSRVFVTSHMGAAHVVSLRFGGTLPFLLQVLLVVLRHTSKISHIEGVSFSGAVSPSSLALDVRAAGHDVAAIKRRPIPVLPSCCFILCPLISLI